MHKVLAVIVTYNGMEWIDRCIRSLLSSSMVPDVFVIDNASTDGTPDHIETEYKDVMLRRSDRNLGFGAANNIGLKYALKMEYSFVYLINQDAWVMEDTIGTLVEASSRDPDYGVLSPVHIDAGGKRIDWRFLVNTLYPNRDVANDLYFKEEKLIYPVELVAAAHWLLPLNTLKVVGGFSPSFFHYGEDYNYADRVRFKGLKLGVVMGARAVHDRSERPWDKDREMRVRAMATVRHISSPGANTSLRMLPYSFRELCVRDVKQFRSLRPILYMFGVLRDLPGIIKNKKISEEAPGAFLQDV